MKVNAYAAKKAKGMLEPFEYESKSLGPNDVEIKILYCGICHSDIHIVDGDWGDFFPVVPGHEIIGEVTNVGNEVNDFKVKDHVGVGWQCGSCMKCEWCLKGEENICEQQEATCMGNHGGYANAIVVNSKFVFSLPPELQSESAAPLLCGGVTVYSPLKKYTKPSMKVGIIGIGGLGHMAIQFAKALGCEVTAFSTSEEKEKEAKAFGATHFIVSTDEEKMKKQNNSLDFILSTVNVKLDYKTYFSILKPNGNFCQVGAVVEPFEIPADEIVVKQKSLTGSIIGSRKRIREMLAFAASKDIKAKVEVLPLSEVNTAINKVRTNKARYRMVLKV